MTDTKTEVSFEAFASRSAIQIDAKASVALLMSNAKITLIQRSDVYFWCPRGFDLAPPCEAASLETADDSDVSRELPFRVRPVAQLKGVVAGADTESTSPSRLAVNELFKDIDVEINEAGLDQPLSLNEAGQIATVRYLLSQSGKDEVRRVVALEYSRPAWRVLRVSQLTDQQLCTLTCAVLESGDPESHLSVAGQGTFTQQQLMEEVTAGTDLGRMLLDGVRHHAELVEAAVASGRLLLRLTKRNLLRIPAQSW